MPTFNDVLVTPFTELLRLGGPSVHRGGPHWPEFDTQTGARHYRGGVPVDDPPSDVPEELTLDGRFAWGGPIVHHFGHQIGEFGTRLGPTLHAWPEAVFLHAALESGTIRSLDRAPGHFKSMLAWHGIPLDRVHFIDRPTRVRELVVLPQAEQIEGGPGPTAAHLDWLDELTARRLGKIVKQGVVYVSRAAMPARFAAEDYLEETLARSGARVVRPEHLSLEEQLRTYASAAQLVFAEGSAMNGAQLLGRTLGEVVVLRRRRGSRIAGNSLAARAKSLRYVEATRGLVRGVTRGGVAEGWAGISVLDDDVLLEAFASLAIPLRKHWSPSEFAARRDADVLRWLKARKDSGNDVGIAASSESIERTLRAAGLGHLLNQG